MLNPANDNDPITFFSVCSGIEAATVAWTPLGWQCVGVSEIEKFPSAVLAHHYPDVPNHGDFTKVDVATLPRVDILCGGTPCQAFSVAGLRRSLDDARGNLSLSFVRLAHELADNNGLRNAVWENVPGVLSTKDNAFGCFLGALVGADDAVPPPAGRRWPDEGMVSGPKGRAAWAILDAQYFGLAQRRKRVILVADFGNGADPAAVLLEFHGLSRNPPTRGEAGQSSAGAVAGSSGSSGEQVGSAHPFDQYNASLGEHISETMAKGDGHARVPSVVYSIMPQNSGKDYKARVVEVAQPVMAAGPSNGNQGGDVVVAFNADAQADQLPSADRDTSINDGLTVSQRAAVAIGTDVFNGQLTGDVAATMGTRGSSTNASGPTVLTSAVRRLTPTECERLQGFPDGYTDIPWRGKTTSPDGPRYKALGNSWAVPKFTWLGRRIAMHMPVRTAARMEAA